MTIKQLAKSLHQPHFPGIPPPSGKRRELPRARLFTSETASELLRKERKRNEVESKREEAKKREEEKIRGVCKESRAESKGESSGAWKAQKRKE